jgi:hypothetical protein
MHMKHSPAQYARHPSPQLNAIFASQPFPHQGQGPDKASVVIFGLDANYSPDLLQHRQFFERILEYHEDGVGFWRRHGVHHPFLLDDYPLKKNTGGVPYHRKFTWLGLDATYADFISFVELLPVPTTGRTESRTFWEMFDLGHARQIDRLVEQGERRMVMLSSSVMNGKMRVAAKRYGVFQWLPREFKLGEMARIGKTVIYGAPHFSSTTYSKRVFVDVGEDIRAFCESDRSASG